MADINNKLEQLKHIADPTRPEPKIEAHLGEIALSTTFNAIGGAIRNYEQTSAHNYAMAQNEVAETALNATDFIKRMDEEVNPKYKNAIMFSQAHRQVFKQQELIAKGITDHERKAGLDMFASTQLSNMAEARKKHGNFGEYEKDIEGMRQTIIDKYGTLPKNFDINYQQIRKQASESYLRGEIMRDQHEYLQQTATGLAQTVYTAEQALTVFEEQIVKQIKNPDDPTQNWKNAALASAQLLVEGAKNMGVAEEIIIGLEKKGYINETQKTRLRNIAFDTMEKNRDMSTELLRRNFDYVKSKHDIGKPVLDSMIYTESQRPTNNFLDTRDFTRMSASQLRYHEMTAETEDIANTMNAIRSSLKKDFEIDFLAALKKRNERQIFSPVTPPSVAEADVKDENGNVIAKKGELVGMDEFLRSVDKRSVLAQTAQIDYGFDIVQSRFGVEEAHAISGVRDSLDTFQKRTNFDREFLKHLKESRVGDPYQDFSYATGDVAAASVYRQMDNPPGITGGATTLLRNYENYDSLRRNNPKAFAEKAAIINKILNNPESQNGTKVLPDVIDEELRLFLQTNAIGATYDLEDAGSITEKVNEDYHYWTSTHFLHPPSTERTPVAFKDWWHGTATFAELLTQTQLSTAQKNAAVLASKRDYSLFKQSLRDKNFSYGMFGDRSLQDILGMDVNLSVKNYNSSLKEFAVVKFKPNNDYDIVLDNDGNPMIFSID